MRCEPASTQERRQVTRRAIAALALSIGSVAGTRATEPGAVPTDPIAAELAHCRQLLRGLPEGSADSQAIREMSEPVFAKAEAALAGGRRLAALYYLALARMNVAAQASLPSGPFEGPDALSALEAEWKRVGLNLHPALTEPGRPDLGAVPAAIRGLAEVAFAEVKPYYDASLEYGRSAGPEYGWFYLGAAQSQLEFARFCARLAVPDAAAPPPLRTLAPELDALEGEILAAYKPPASIDSHPQFIRMSATLKQARELDRADLRYGALYLYLEARLRLSRLTGGGRAIDLGEAVELGRTAGERFDREAADHTVGRLFVELALVGAADPDPKAKGGEVARAVFDDVLPRYFAALEPAKPPPPTPAPAVTVTLVRWPYT